MAKINVIQNTPKMKEEQSIQSYSVYSFHEKKLNFIFAMLNSYPREVADICNIQLYQREVTDFSSVQFVSKESH